MKKAVRIFSMRFRGIKIKAANWARRFLPAEIGGTITAVACAYAATNITNNRVTIAFAVSVAETIGFYLTIIVTDVLLAKKKLQPENMSLTFRQLLLIFRDILLDFGPAEIIDSFVSRPLFMYVFPLWLGNYTWGVIAGKFASDFAFYIPVIISGEIRTRISRRG
jgi:hypothetical protein